AVPGDGAEHPRLPRGGPQGRPQAGDRLHPPGVPGRRPRADRARGRTGAAQLPGLQHQPGQGPAAEGGAARQGLRLLRQRRPGGADPAELPRHPGPGHRLRRHAGRGDRQDLAVARAGAGHGVGDRLELRRAGTLEGPQDPGAVRPARDAGVSVSRPGATPMATPDLVTIWADHIAGEFTLKDVEHTLSTMVEDAYVNHMPVNTGGRGKEQLRRFYREDFIPSWPDDLQMTLTNRVLGESQLVEELHLRF